MSFSSEVAARDLAQGDLEGLRERYPKEWDRVSGELLDALSKGKAEAAAAWLEAMKADANQWQARVTKSAGNPKVYEAAFPHLLRHRLARLALAKTSTALAARETTGTVRLGLWSGTLIQRLFFRKGLERKPASLRAVRFWWKWIFDRRLLMPLVQPRGIYCFYSQELVAALVTLIAGRSCLELAAGDGTLARFLSERGCPVTATDDASWSHAISYPAGVERLDAKSALRKYAPKVVLCSWPPPGNPFEKVVFDTASVELYVVIGSRHHFAAGDFPAYERQAHFEWQLDPALSMMVLPPELDPAVYVFRRKPKLSRAGAPA
ncbi:MAG: class I SAM-dependent methyltransferase [Archangium sp.]|nr:class I SAM-dependent methyltransferase [Archangium sp.]